MSSLPDLVRILLILLENLNPDQYLILTSVIFSNEFLLTYTRRPNRVYWLSYMQKTLKNRMIYKTRLSTCTWSHVNINTHENDNQFSEHFRQEYCPLRTLEMAFQSIKSSKFVGEHAPTNSWQLVPSAIVRFISDWKISQLRLDSLLA